MVLMIFRSGGFSLTGVKKLNHEKIKIMIQKKLLPFCWTYPSVKKMKIKSIMASNKLHRTQLKVKKIFNSFGLKCYGYNFKIDSNWSEISHCDELRPGYVYFRTYTGVSCLVFLKSGKITYFGKCFYEIKRINNILVNKLQCL